MKVALWAEIRRLHEIEKLSGWAIAKRLHCSRHTVAKALRLEQPPTIAAKSTTSILDPFHAKIDALVARYPDLSAVRIREELAKPPDGYSGGVSVVRRYLRKTRPARGRVYVKHNALAGRDDELVTFADYVAFAPRWRDSVANVRIHETTREPPLDRFQRERPLLRPLPSIPFDTDEIVPCIVSTHARVKFDGNRYSVPPSLHRRTVTLRADAAELRVLVEGQVVVRHQRCYERGQLIVLPEHRLAALEQRKRSARTTLEQQFDDLGPEARQFHLNLKSRPVKTSTHLRRLLGLAQLYGRKELLAAIVRAAELATYDAAYVENLLLAERRRRQLPTPTLPAPRRAELIDEIELDPADPSIYDRLFNVPPEDSHDAT
jgi:Mu transposase-like protein